MIALILPLRRIVAAADLADAAAQVRALCGAHVPQVSQRQTATLPGLQAVTIVAIRILDARGPTEICAVALGPHTREDFMAALGACASSPRAAA